MADRYRFGEVKRHDQTYKDGTVVPHAMVPIYRMTASRWRRVGYIEIHLHRVRRDDTDVEDISIGVTARVNPKQMG